MQQQTNFNQQQNFEKKSFNQNEKPKDVRKANIIAAKGEFFLIFSCGRCNKNITRTQRNGQDDPRRSGRSYNNQ